MTRWSGLIMTCVLLLAGCASPGPEGAAAGPSTDLGPPVASLTFDPEIKVADIPNTGHEAFLEVSADGLTLLTCAHGDFRAPAFMFASTDGGATFKQLDVGTPMPFAGDCEVALGPNDEWSFSGKTELGITVVTTKDGGESWIINHLASPPINGGADRQWLTYAGTTLLLSHQPGTQEVGSIVVARSTDYGATWSTPKEAVAADAAQPWIGAGHFIVASDGSILMPITRTGPPTPVGPGPPTRLMMARSSDEGATWTLADVASVGPQVYATGAAQSGDGTLLWAFSDDGGLSAITSSDMGVTWSEPLAIGSGLAWDRPWTSGRPDGSFDVIWESDGTQFNATTPALALSRVRFENGTAGSFVPTVESSIVADVDFIEFASVAHDATGRAHVVTTRAPQLMRGELTQGVTGTLLLVQETVADAS